MNALLVFSTMLLATVEAASQEPPGCTCALARETDGWCAAHGVGYLGPVEIRSERLYEALDAHGHDVNLDTFDCPACRRAIAEEGFCEEHRIGFVARQAYFSRLSYHLAKGEKRERSEIACPTCRKNAGGHGWCETCKVGMVGRVAIRSRGDYEQVVKTLGILQAANEAVPRCEHCAVAIVTDTQCPVCRIHYKDGKVAEPPPPPSEAAAPDPK